MKKWILTLVFLGLVLESNVAQPETIHLVQGLENPKSITLTDLIEHIDYVKLETNKNCLIGRISELDIFNSDIYLVAERLYRFGMDGSFKNTISGKGKGPGEYIELGGIDFEPEQKLFYLFDRSTHTGQKFSPEGAYLGVLRKISGFNSKLVDEKNVCTFNPSQYLTSSKDFTISIVDHKGNVAKKLVQNRLPSNLDSSRKVMFPSLLYRFKDSLTCWEGYQDTVFRITRALKSYPRFVFDLSNYRAPIQLDKPINDPGYIKECNKYIIILSFVEVDNYLFFNIIDRGVFKRVIFDKRLHECYTLGNQPAIINDFDGGLAFWPQGVTSDGRLYFVASVVSLKELTKSKNPGSLKYPDKLQTLKSMIDSLDDSDNPVLIFITMK